MEVLLVGPGAMIIYRTQVYPGSVVPLAMFPLLVFPYLPGACKDKKEKKLGTE